MKKIYNSNWLFKLKSTAVLCSMLFAGTAMAQLSGSYTIDAGGGGDFTSFTELSDTLMSNGVSGAVTVDVVASSGPYNEEFYLDAISGSSSTNTITINGNDEKITYNGLVVELEGTNFITFNDLVMESTSTNAAGRIFHGYDGISDLTLDGCELIASNSNAYGGYPAYYQGAYIWLSDANWYYNDASDETENVTINNCKLWKGSTNLNGRGLNFGIYIANNSLTSDQNINITNNDIQDIGQFGMYMKKSSGGVFENNTIHNENNNSSTYCYGLYVYNYFFNGSVEVRVEHNNIYDLITNRAYAYATTYGMYIYTYYSNSDMEINNNTINLYGPYYVGGIYHYGYQGSGDVNMRYNSIHIDGNATYAYARHYGIYTYYQGGSGFVENNVIVDATQNWAAGNGGAWCIYEYQTNTTFDYNNLYNEDMQGSAVNTSRHYGYDGTNQTSFSDWVNGKGGANSVNFDANFTDVANNDLTPQSIAMANKGKVVSTTVDQSYAARSATTPDLGAIEYFVDVEVVSVDMVGGTECAPYTEGVVATIKNNGPNDLSGIPLQYTINGGAAYQEIVGGSLAAGASMSFTFTAPANLYGSTTHAIVVSVVGDDDVPANSDASHSITTTASPTGGDLTQSGTWNGYFNNGSMGDPDVTVKDYIIEYDITRPTAYSASAPSTAGDYQYSVTATTTGGVDVTAMGFSLTNGDETLTVDPDPSLADSTIFMEIMVLDNNTLCDTTFGRYLYVPHTPVASFTPNDICLGDVATFKNTSTLGGSDYMLNTWEFDDPDPAVTDDNSDIKDGFWSYTTYGSADVVLTVINGVYPLFEYTETHTITVTPKPELDFKVLNACEGTPIQFNNSSKLPQGISGTIAYSWNFAGEGASTLENPTFTFTTPGQRVVTLNATANGCGAKLSKNAYQFEMPTASFVPPTSACNYEKITFSNTSVIPNNANMGFAWDFNNEGISRLKNPEYPFATPGTKTVTLTATSEFGCESVSTETIVLEESPEADFSWDAACNLTPINFTFTGSAPNNGAQSSFVWDYNGENTETNPTSPMHLFSDVGAKNVTLTVADVNGCTNSITKEINVVLQAKAAFAVKDVCEGDEAIFTNSSTVAAGDLEYIWEFGDAGASTSTNLNPRFEYPVTGNTRIVNVTLNAIVPGGCPDVLTKSLTINAAPDASFSANRQGRHVEFTGPSGMTIYQWRFGDGAKSTVQNPSYTYNNVDNGSYEVCLTTKNTICEDECQTVVIDLLGVEKLAQDNDMINVYPNPNAGSFNLEIANASDDVVIKVGDILGNEVPVELVDMFNGKYSVNMSAIADGVYFVQVKNGDFYATKRITVSK